MSTDVANSADTIVAYLEAELGFLSLEYHPPELREYARQALAKRDAFEFLCYAGNHHGLKIAYLNRGILAHLGILEPAFFNAMIDTRTNNHGDYALIDSLVERLDRARLRVAGDPLPGSGPWTIYRGVAGHGKARRVRGYSWTADQEQAAWFAHRYDDGPDPAVFLHHRSRVGGAVLHQRKTRGRVLREPFATPPRQACEAGRESSS